MSRYMRLMALCMTELSLTIPLSVAIIWVNAVAFPLDPWTSLSDTHYDYGRVEQITRAIYTQNKYMVMSIEFTKWTSPASGIIFFAYFGFADEAVRHYKKAFWVVASRFGYSPSLTLLKSHTPAKHDPQPFP